MTDNDLTKADCEIIQSSLDWTIQKFSEYRDYPSYEFKQARLREVQTVRERIISLKQKMKAA